MRRFEFVSFSYQKLYDGLVIIIIIIIIIIFIQLKLELYTITIHKAG
jgi:hypothetical protein